MLWLILRWGNSNTRGRIPTFVARDRMGSFNSVKPNMKLKLSIQRGSKNQGGIVGQTRKLAVVVEWELIFHEVLLIQNNCRELTNERVMEHHGSIIYQELRGSKSLMIFMPMSPIFLTCHSLSKSQELDCTTSFPNKLPVMR